MTPARTKRTTRVMTAAVIAVLLTAGCASSTPPAGSVPELRSTLARVDRAIVEERYGEARTHVEHLVRTTIAARDDGELERTEAEPILAAAASLMSALPRPQPPETEHGPSTPPESDPGEDREQSDEDDTDDTNDEAEKNREKAEKRKEEAEKREDKEKDKKDDDEGGGNGDSDDNGPDDGEGN